MHSVYCEFPEVLTTNNMWVHRYAKNEIEKSHFKFSFRSEF